MNWISCLVMVYCLQVEVLTHFRAFCKMHFLKLDMLGRMCNWVCEKPPSRTTGSAALFYKQPPEERHFQGGESNNILGAIKWCILSPPFEDAVLKFKEAVAQTWHRRHYLVIINPWPRHKWTFFQIQVLSLTLYSHPRLKAHLLTVLALCVFGDMGTESQLYN